MRPGSLALLVLLGASPTAVADPPSQQAELEAWASQASYALSSFKSCKGIEETYFEATGSVCWSAKSKSPRPSGSRMFPRMSLTLATYKDEAAARARMKRWRTVPKQLGEADKAYPLRAGFRLGSRVLVITTDAFAFQRDVDRAAAALSKALGGTELTCWKGACP